MRLRRQNVYDQTPVNRSHANDFLGLAHPLLDPAKARNDSG